VKLAKALMELGLTLKRAHAAVDKLASGERAIVEIKTDNIRSALTKLSKFGLSTSIVFRASSVDPKKIRENQDLSQSEFASLYGLDERTLQNWEQRRYEPDTPAKVLLTIIEKNPDFVVRTLYNMGVGATASGNLIAGALLSSTATVMNTFNTYATSYYKLLEATSRSTWDYRSGWSEPLKEANHSWCVTPDIEKQRA
jgi:DNA-binding transcriptional regulator YiaG